VDAQRVLTDYSLPITLAILLLSAWAWSKGLIQMRHFDVIMGSTFAGCAYLAACEGHLVAAAWYATVAGFKAVLYYRQRPRPLDGSHEAL